MRVIAGKYKKSNLLTLKGNNTRPTKDLVKEALFSMLEINEKTIFLDLFSGSGAIGIEALSRGANDVIFNDNNKEAIKIIQSNLNKFKEKRTILNYDYITCLSYLHDNNYHFDYIFIDPPYVFSLYDDLLKIIYAYNLLNENGSVIIETEKKTNLNDEIGEFKKYKEKIYGISKLSFYKNLKKSIDSQ